MDVARLNFSHGTHEEHAEVIARLRELSKRLGKPIAVLQDLSGPKVRLGDFAGVVSLRRGQEVGFSAGASRTEPMTQPLRHSDPLLSECPILPLPSPGLLDALGPNDSLLLDDGNIALRVIRCEGDPGDPERVVWTRVVVGGELKPRKGVTAPGVTFSVAAVTEKDKDDLRFGLAQGVDWVAASYVRFADDLLPLKAVMEETGSRVPLIAKIEKFEAVKNLASILAAVDGIMVARGDLGVEIPFDEVPLVQKQIIKLCNQAGKPVITATQMLESMVQNARPTRAEAADVANAILDGTDAVMLSGETAAGQYPVEAVQTMARIALRTEGELFRRGNAQRDFDPPRNTTEVVARAAADIACELRAAAILCSTTSGGTARMVAKYRPRVPILAVTNYEPTIRQLALTWGVTSLLIGPVSDTDTMMASTVNAALHARRIKVGDQVILTAGIPVNNPGTTNLIKVHTAGMPFNSTPTADD